jgi:hypothetical protein
MAQATRWVKLILLAAVASRCLLRIRRFSSSVRTGMLRIEVAVGTVRLASMFSTTRSAPPRMGWAMSPGRMAGTVRALHLVARKAGGGILTTERSRWRLGRRRGRDGGPPRGPGRPVRGAERVRVPVPASGPRGGGRNTPASSRPPTAGCPGTARGCRGQIHSSPRNPSRGRRRVDPPASAALEGQSSPWPEERSRSGAAEQFTSR